MALLASIEDSARVSFPNFQSPDRCADFKSHPAAALANALDSKLRNIVPGAFTPVLAKRTKHISLEDRVSGFHKCAKLRRTPR